MGQGQGKGQYSQIGESFEAESPDGPDLPPEPDNVLNRAQNTFNEIKTHAEQAVLRAKVLTGQELDLENVGETKAEDMTFVFHSGEGDSDDRVVHEDEAREKNCSDEPRWRIFRKDNQSNILFGERLKFEHFVDIKQMNLTPGLLSPGTIVEFGKAGEELNCAIVNHDEIIYWRDGRVMNVKLRNINYKCRILRNLYNLKTYSPTEIIVRASESAKSTCLFSNSEAWANWCRYGVPDFQAIQSNQEWVLEWVDLGRTEKFSSLDLLLTHRREREANGLAKLKSDFGVKTTVVPGMVPCLR